MNRILKLPITFLWYLKFKKNENKALEFQERIFNQLIQKAQDTEFGKDNNFRKINSYEDFKKLVPLQEYKDLKPYLDRVLEDEENILWPTPYKYLLATAKSTGDVQDKFIPISSESLKDLVKISVNMLLNFGVKTKNYNILFKKNLYLGASPKLKRKGKYPLGLLSGVSYYLKPKFLRNLGLPSFKTNSIENWEEKLAAIENEVMDKNLGIIVGTPPWVNMFISNLNSKLKTPLNKYFKDLTLFMFGGAPIDLYRKDIQEKLGKEVQILENYPASEGFIGFQDEFPESKGQLLQTNHGIFFEFIKKEDYYNNNWTERISLRDVELNQEYALILNTNSGFFGYLIGDIVEFTTLKPFRVKIAGRLRHYLKYKDKYYNDADLSRPLSKLVQENNWPIGEFTFAPSENGIELFYETQKNEKLSEETKSKIQKTLKLDILFTQVQEDTIYQYMKSIQKLGMQFKITRIRNDRNIAEHLERREE